MPMGNPHPNLAPYEKYTTRTGEIFVASGNDLQFRKLCEALGVPELGRDPRFLTNADRVTNRPALTEQLSAALIEQDGAELCQRLLRTGLPAGPVLAIDESMAAAHTETRGMVTELGDYRGLGTPIKMSRTPGGTRRPPPKFAEHSQDVLTQHGYSAEAIEKLEKDGILHTSRRR
jgi:formyl-CoA transferase